MSINKWGKQHRSPIQIILHRITNDIFSIISLILFIILLFICFFNKVLIPFPDSFCGIYMMPPSWAKDGNLSFILGTDYLGRDIFSRILLGARTTAGASMIITFYIAIIGTLLTVLSLFFNKTIFLIKAILNTLFVIPVLLLAIGCIIIIGNSPEHITFVVILALIPRFFIGLSHIIHIELKKEYIIATQLDGASKFNILIYSVFPNIASHYLYDLTRVFSFALLILIALNYIQLGTVAYGNDWGSLMREYQTIIDINPWAFISSGLAPLISIIIIHLFSTTLIKVLRND